MLEMLLNLNLSKELITREHFNKWKRDPITVRLHNDLMIALLEQMSEDLPESIDRSIPLVHQREGARKLAEVLLYWEPIEVRNDRESENED